MELFSSSIGLERRQGGSPRAPHSFLREALATFSSSSLDRRSIPRSIFVSIPLADISCPSCSAEGTGGGGRGGGQRVLPARAGP